MAKNKFYAIKKGVHPKTKEPVRNIILQSWEEAKEYVLGVKGSEYKSFSSKEDAEAYLGIGKTEQAFDPDALYCYVDGSYNAQIPNYGYGLVCVKKGEIVHVDKGTGNNPDAVEMHQIGGELLGAIKALLFAKAQGHPKVVIFHDYIGVATHATGEWKRTNEFSKTYFEWMQKFFKENPNISVSFSKVQAHAGNDFNEIADGLAKLAVGLKPNPIFYRMIEKHALNIAGMERAV